MKKKYVILIIIGLVLVIGGYFGYKGFYLYKYVISEKHSKIVLESKEGLNIKETINIEKHNNKGETINYKNISIRNDFKDFSLSDEFDNTYGNTYILESDKGMVRFSIGKTPFNFIQAIEGNGDKETKRIKTLLKEKNISTDLDLIKYAIENKDNKPNIFSSKQEMELYYYIYNIILMFYPKIESITLIDGELKGFMLNYTEFPSKEVYIMNDTDKYVLIFWNKEYFTDDYIKELLDTVTINI